MKHICTLALAALVGMQAYAAEKQIIRISTDQTDLVLQVAPNGRLYQSYLGEKLLHESDLDLLGWSVHPASDASVIERGWEVCSTSGNEDFFEPAWGVTHSDGNPSTWLYYVSSSTKQVEGGTQTDILLRDDKYPVDVTLHYIAYPMVPINTSPVFSATGCPSPTIKKGCACMAARLPSLVSTIFFPN